MSIERARALNGLVLVGCLALFVLGASHLQNDYLVKVTMLIGMNILLAVSLALASGFTGVFSLGQIGFMAIGAYASSLLTIPPSAKTHTLLPGLPGWIASLDPVQSVASALSGIGLAADTAELAAGPLALVVAACAGALLAA